ncbi:hypothetical protein SAMN02745244_00618 [Tessaracoccus bendigoensis DSM 12906]|uniref:Uncharacterized protein n=1 Tax=Tessaracoccus bendigoensis DSM 12906 TaxID=1123357 RepID=A0A1M6C905_9ACTN|nr:hypothetical protein [Tessaracoccus bendigoensis]SHI57281.1 hypothetical protein SAMN02745244_00618 [Tessaracoccus bendigoensis DSM 12906]
MSPESSAGQLDELLGARAADSVAEGQTIELPVVADPERWLPEEGEDKEFLPRLRNRRPRSTTALIVLAIWCAGFLVGVIVDRGLFG